MKYFFLSLTLVLTAAFTTYSQTATFSGRVTDQNTGQGIPDVAVVVLGNQTGTRVAITDTQGNYATSMGANTRIKLRAYRTNYVFNPLQVLMVSLGGPIVGSQPWDFVGSSFPFPIFIIIQEPILLTEDNSLTALSVDSLTFQRDPFPLLNNDYLGNDKRTRIKLLLVDLELFSGETLSVISAQGIDQSQVSYNLPVEDLRKVPGAPWLTQLTVMLPGDLAPGVLTVSVTARGKASNSATFRIQ